MVYKTPSSCFPAILYCVKMRKVESINFRFGGRSTTFCSSGSIVIYCYSHSAKTSLKQNRYCGGIVGTKWSENKDSCNEPSTRLSGKRNRPSFCFSRESGTLTLGKLI